MRSRISKKARSKLLEEFLVDSKLQFPIHKQQGSANKKALVVMSWCELESCILWWGEAREECLV
ncbi:hypothetical protein DY000_02032297 [Brassica cretica]|uniref:Uncharacterized protein n=1 Tax=Brassica cretica TaxID=69181 RepID=A0ABQ7DVY7_BRACR|nr:hypothetical protein DY000_02032297 [Brassica cretica]